MADLVVGMVLTNAQKLIQDQSALDSSATDHVRGFSRTLQDIQTYLHDAAEKELKEDSAKLWLREVKGAAYEVDDILDRYRTKVSQLEYKRGSMKNVSGLIFKLNPKDVAFRHSIYKKMKKAQGELDGIIKMANDFGLQTIIADGQVEARADCVTSFLVPETVYGRKEDEQKIVKHLVEDAAGSDDLSVYPILGVGGLGKTTLARKIIKNQRIISHFEPIIWICVPEESPRGGANVADDFDVKAMISKVIRTLSKNPTEAIDFESLKKEVQRLLKGKRYLLVLDDVWNVSKDNWDQLKEALSCGSKEALIVITTCSKKVAKIVRTFSPYKLSGLKYDDCWSVFNRLAFMNNEEISPSIGRIAHEIVQKCKGVPLVAKTLGSLLWATRSEKKWENIRDSELWKVSDKNFFLRIIGLSYLDLPSHVKQCFVFCAIFPKGYKIDTKLLIHLWIANGFISSTGALGIDDGNIICQELAYRSLFEELEVDDSGNIFSFKMHSLVYDLARYLAQDEIVFKEGMETRHLNVLHSVEPFCIPVSEYKAKSLRTLLFTSIHQFSDFPYLRFDGSFVSFSKFQKVRAIVARGLSSQALSPSIGNLKYLRHLDFSHSTFELLPKSICELWNLQILDLTDCKVLRGLPRRTGCLKNLWYLYLTGCDALKDSPPRLGEITGLKILNIFVVGKSKGCGLSELGQLDLKGELHIKHLERVRKSDDANRANMGEKKDLRILILSWEMSSVCDKILWKTSSIRDKDLEVLEALEPHRNIEQLKINGYKSTTIPLWMGHSHYSKLVSIKLSDIEKWSGLSQLGRLPSLNELEIQTMKCMKYIDDSENHPEGPKIFPSLEKLRISDSESLLSLSKIEGIEIFPRLTHMYISKCPQLTLSNLPSVSELVADGRSTKFLDSISNLRKLTSLSIDHVDKEIEFSNETFKDLTVLKSLKINDCNKLKSLPELGLQDLQSLECLEILGCRNLKSLSSGLQHLTALKKLFIYGCPELTSFPFVLGNLVSLKCLCLNGISILAKSKLDSLPEALQHVPNLASLQIYEFPNLVLLPEWLGNLTSLQTLEIGKCENLESLPDSMIKLERLQSLFLLGCGQKLEGRCQKYYGEDWHKIAHIPNVAL